MNSMKNPINIVPRLRLRYIAKRRVQPDRKLCGVELRIISMNMIFF